MADSSTDADRKHSPCSTTESLRLSCHQVQKSANLLHQWLLRITLVGHSEHSRLGVRSRLPGGDPRRRMPALKCQRGRTSWIPLAAESSVARSRPLQKAGMSDGGAQFFPHTGRRHDSGGVVFWSETSFEVCSDFSIGRDTTQHPAVHRDESYGRPKGSGWPTP